MSKSQKLILVVLGFITLLALVGLAVIIWPNIKLVIYPPTKTPIIMPASYIETVTSALFPTLDASPAVRQTPTTRIKRPTWTPLPSWTPMSSLVKVPRNNGSAPVQVGTACSAQYAYIESLHQYYLDFINSLYNNTLAYYQSLKQDALESRDGMEMIRIDEDIARVEAERDSHINSENSRYEADRSNLDAQCK